MATIQEIQAAAKLKREKNITPAQAVAEVRATSNPPVTPPATPAPTVQGVNGEKFVQATVNPATGVSAPIPQVQPTETPAPTAPVETATQVKAQETPPPPPNTEVDTIKAQNEAQMALNKQKSQLAIQERKQAEADAKLASIPTDQKGITQSLISGISVAPQNTQAYRNAVTVANQFKKFNGMTDVQLLDNLKQGQIGTELDSLLSQNPNYAKAKAELAKAQKTASINRATQFASNIIKGKENTVVDDLSNIEAKYNPPIGANAQAYQDYVVKNPDVITAGVQLKSLSTQISELSKTYNDALKSLKSQYGDMPPSALLTLMSSRTKDTKELLDTYINAKELAKGDFDMAMKMAEGSYEAYGKDLAEKSKIDAEQRAMKNSLALSQMEFEQQVAQNAQTMNTPELAIPSVINQYAEQGIMASKSAQQHIADAKAFIAKGGTLGEYISQMQKDFQAKDSYKAKFGTQKAPTIQNFGTSDKPDYRQYNQTTGQWDVVAPLELGASGDLRGRANEFPGQAWAKNNNPAGITWNANFDKGTGTAALLKQAGIEYSKGTARPASEGGNYVTFNTIEDGLKAQRIIMSQTYGNLTVGQMLAKWVGTSEGPNYARQVATNAGVDTNAIVSSLSEDQLGKLQMAKIQKESPGLAKILMQGVEKGGIDDIKMQALSLVQGLGGTADERQAFADNVIKVAQRDNISLAEAKKKLGYKSADDTEFAKARGAEYKSIKADTRDKLSNANTALTLLNSPQTAIGDVASIVGFLKTIDPASVARESEVDSVRNARGVIDSLSNQFAQLKEGTKLTDSQRTQLKDSIQTIVDAGNAKYNEYVTDTTREFEDRGLDATVYIPKKEIEKAKSTSQSQAPRAKLTKEKVLDIYNKWKSNKK